MKRMRGCLFSAVGILLAMQGVALARNIALPPTSPSTFPDSVTLTNAVLPAAAMENTRLVEASLSLLATPSNRLEVAFGATGGRDLLPGDEDFSFGWDGGRWFFASPTNRVEGAALEGVERRTLAVKLRVREDGKPTSFETSPPDPAFMDWMQESPTWLFSREWNRVRVTASGSDEPCEAVSIRLDPDGVVLILK